MVMTRSTEIWATLIDNQTRAMTQPVITNTASAVPVRRLTGPPEIHQPIQRRDAKVHIGHHLIQAIPNLVGHLGNVCHAGELWDLIRDRLSSSSGSEREQGKQLLSDDLANEISDRLLNFLVLQRGQ